MIIEPDIFALARDFPAQKLEAGDTGNVVMFMTSAKVTRSSS